MDFRPPLAFIQPESRHRALWKHYLEAKAEKDRPSCLGAACTGCAACSDTVQVTAMTRHPGPKPQSESSLALCSALLASKARFQPCHVAIELGPGLVGSVSAYRASYILRMLSRHRPGIESSVFEARELYAPDLENWYGWCVYSLIGPVPRRLGTMVEGLPWCRVLGTQPRPSALDIELSLGKWEPARLESARKIFETWSAESGRGCTSRKTTQGWLFSQGEKAGADSKPGSDPSLIRRDEILILQLPSIQGQRLKSLASRLEKALGEGTVARVRGWDGMDYGSSGTIASH